LNLRSGSIGITCEILPPSVNVKVGCSPYSNLKFNQTFKTTYTLPVNYRPPSHLGKGVPTTNNMYHGDPSRGKHHEFYQISKSTGRYKQCANATNKEECNCTADQAVSFLIKDSDCIKTVRWLAKELLRCLLCTMRMLFIHQCLYTWDTAIIKPILRST
jgi:hypothetical protein